MQFKPEILLGIYLMEMPTYFHMSYGVAKNVKTENS